jgi:hypothetical protein
MKPKTFKKKLVFKKATIANLNLRNMKGVRGGGVVADPVEPEPKTTLLVIRCCPVNTVPDCISDPPTECWTCPYTWNSPCCAQPTDTVEPVEPAGIIR